MDEPGSAHIRSEAIIRTFLIADIRGYTLFTQERGDETAAKLASRFAELTKEGVEARDGELIELRGDEALAVFRSARQAIRAAVDLQTRFVKETLRDPTLPLPVGIGLDAGEAVPVGDGYRGDALNLAARLCGQAGPGEVLASQGVVHLARRVEGVRYVERGELHLRGSAQPVRAVKVLPEDSDPAIQLAPFAPRPLPHPPGRPRGLLRRPRSARQLVILIVVLALIGAGIPLLLTVVGNKGLSAIGENAVGLIDLDSGRIVATVPVGVGPAAVVEGEGSVWVVNRSDASVSRIDPRERRVVANIPVGTDPSGIAAGHGAVWVTSTGEGTVYRINPDTHRVVRNVPVGNGPRGIAVDETGVWVANSFDNAVVRIDPKTNEVAGEPLSVAAPTDIAIGHSSLWVASATGSIVYRINLASGAQVPIQVGKGPRAIAVGKDSVWVANSLDRNVSRIDPSTDQVDESKFAGESPVGVAISDDAVWTADELGLIQRIDGMTTELVGTIKVDESLAGTAVAGGFLWVTSRGSPTNHVGGTLTAVSPIDRFRSTDPALASFCCLAQQVFAVTGDGLVGFRRVGGVEGTTLVPDLAESLPIPGPGGGSYTFRVRPGIRYSTGQAVKPTDFRRAVERAFKVGGDTGIFRGIVGADACAERPATCDLSEGIKADDRGRTVTFDLMEPDPDFLVKLTTPQAFPVPEGVPNRKLERTERIPGTGPYRIDKFDPDKRLELVRNPYFREWSRAAQPTAFADRVVFRFDVTAEEGAEEVIAGRTDYVNLVPKGRLEEMATRFTPQFHRYLLWGVFFFFLNTAEPPFDDVNARRAVNYAVDREVALERYPEPAAITCQAVPPNFPGYRPYCPYTIDPDGTWTAPDMAKAKDLVEASGTSGKEVEVFQLPFFPDVTEYFASVLRDLGYDVSIKPYEDPVQFITDVNDSRNHVQTGGLWFAAVGVPSIADHMEQFSCDAIVRGNPSLNGNIAQFCDRDIDTMIEEARDLEATSPLAAGEAWAAIDRAVTDRAPFASLLTPGGADFLSEHVGNYQYSPAYFMLLSQLWVR